MRLGEEVKRMLDLCHYKVVVENLVGVEGGPEFKAETPSFAEIKIGDTLEVEMKKKNYKATREDKLSLLKANFLKVVNMPDEEEEVRLWRMYYKQITKRKIFKQAYLEKLNCGSGCLQRKDFGKIWAEISPELHPRYEVIQRLNKVLGLENSFAESKRKFGKEEFAALGLPVLKDPKIQSIYRMIKLEEKDASYWVNKILVIRVEL